jgi:hypothetical protein
MTLAGERELEYKFINDKLPRGDGMVLELGPEPRGKVAMLAIERGWRVVAVGLEQVQRQHPRLTFMHGDFGALDIAGRFDWVVCVSTIEHFGLGRYGDPVGEDLDLAAMRKLRGLAGKMLLTVPVGVDAVFKPWHRVYGAERLPRLLDGWRVVEQHFRAKVGSDVYEAVSMDVALAQMPTATPFYYALGLFVLEAT